MRQGTYLNVILTVNAVLLAGLTWTQISESSVLANQAHAQNAGARRPAGEREIPRDRIRVPNAARQRAMIEASVRDLNGSLNELKSYLESGRMKVEVTNLDDIEVSID